MPLPQQNIIADWNQVKLYLDIISVAAQTGKTNQRYRQIVEEADKQLWDYWVSLGGTRPTASV